MAKVETYVPGQRVLWRYLDTAKYLDFLYRKALFFSRGDQFQDKYEGAFTNSIKRGIEEAYRKSKIKIGPEEFRRRLRERVFLNCWHQSTNDSMAMWRLYGKSDSSVAVTTTVGKLKDQIEKGFNGRGRIFLRKVEYIKHWRDPELDINPYSNVFSYKLVAYDYEKEVRVIIDRLSEEPNHDETEEGISIPVDPNSLITGVVVMPEAQPWYVDLIRELSEKFGLEATVRRSKLAAEPT